MTGAAQRSHPWRAPAADLALVTAVLLAGCAAPTPPPPAAEPPAPQPARVGPAPIDPGVRRFEQRQQARAEQASRNGHLAEAALAWEVLTLVQPGSALYRQQLAQTRQAIDREVAQRVARANAAQSRGDVALAEKTWLEILALDPGHDAASQALRELERERNRSSAVGRFASPPGQLFLRNGATMSGGQAPAAGRPVDVGSGLPGQRNAVEHASMLADQGELDAAISLLVEQYGPTPGDPQVRRLLAGMYLQRAERQTGRDRGAAIADLERALALDPRLEPARVRLRQLRPTGR